MPPLRLCTASHSKATPAIMTDPYHNPDALSASTIDAIITRLEERGRHPFFLAAINQYVGILERDRKLSILELGCGTGVVIRYVETLVHPSCVLRAADISEQFLQGACVLAPSSDYSLIAFGSCKRPRIENITDRLGFDQPV
jgi:SAM-dependent methyltransferase